MNIQDIRHSDRRVESDNVLGVKQGRFLLYSLVYGWLISCVKWYHLRLLSSFKGLQGFGASQSFNL